MLTRAKMRDAIAKRTGYHPGVVAHVLDELEQLVEGELLQQGEVVFRGLFRVVPSVRTYRRAVKKKGPGLLDPQETSYAPVPRIILSIRPVRSLRRKLTDVLRSG